MGAGGDLVAQQDVGDDVDVHAEQGAEFFGDPGDPQERVAVGCRVEVDQQVDIAAFCGVAAGY